MHRQICVLSELSKRNNKSDSFISPRVGELWRLDTDCVVNVTNESLTYHGDQSAKLFQHAGPQLAEECKALMGIRTGEAKVTEG